MVAVKILAFFVFLGVVASEPVEFKACPGNAGKCTVNAVRITPCAEAASNEPCKIKRGRSAGIEFDYITDFDAPTVSSRAYWVSEVDLPLLDMETDSCKFTPCPIVKNEQRSFNQSLPLSRKFPVRTYQIKWRMTAEEDNECCFMTSIKLVR